MSSTTKLQLNFTDRVGIIADIANLMSRQAVNIASMEVDVEEVHTTVYLEVDAPSTIDWDAFYNELRTISDLKDIATIQTLPQEKREKRLQVVLNNMSDGILGIDDQGEVVIINRVAQNILGCDARTATGRNISELNLSDHGLLECLTGKSFSNRKRNLIAEHGRFQFLSTGKPIHDSSQRIVGAIEIMKDMQEIKELSNAVTLSAQFSFSDMIGESPALMEAISFAQKIAATDAVVSIHGESGTGKELFAHAIHTESGRRGPFIPLNCAALPETLLESELFGYVGGAFSGALKEGKAGLFEGAKDGTIFLDEIAEMPLALQAKMLRVIQEKKVRRIGSSQELAINARIITATNKDLAKMVEEKRFREDLYYRICVFPIHIPPLRERSEDIRILVEHFLFHLNSRLGRNLRPPSAQAIERLCRYPWPGNVRELRNVIERTVILSPTETIEPDSLLFGTDLGSSMKGLVGQMADSSEEGSLPSLINRYEKQILANALKQSHSKRQAAKLLGISHTTLLNKLKKHKI
ncbi:MAG: sigma 54-interacting transcriptional regulator [Geopsychrobacter sp.]|nr:sigma 54-interacting transcriptional regulator [Geopsychrobacter sp.]